MSIQAAIANSSRRFGQWETWTWGLLNAIVVGGFTSIGSWFGMLAAHGSGVDVPVLNFKALGVIFISGAGVRFCAYMAQGLPQLTQTVDTSFTQMAKDGSVTSTTSKVTTTAPASLPLTAEPAKTIVPP